MAFTARLIRPTIVGAILAFSASVEAADIVNVDELSAAIKSGSNKKVAFLTQANFDSVHNMLPSSIEKVICDNTTQFSLICDSVTDMIELIKNGDVLAGLISGLPESTHAPSLNTFSSTVVSTRAMLMAPIQSSDTPHGTSSTSASSYELSLAVDAAVVSLQQAGKDEEIRLANMPFEFIAVHTCKGSDLTAFSVPNYASATGLLRTTLDSRVLKVGSLGPYDWGGNDGNYKVTPHKGFYPDWFTEFCKQFNDLTGADGVKYSSQGAITCTRVWQLSSAKVFKDLFEGNSYVTEPYYIVDGFYTGSGETCSSSNDCRPSVSGRENCESSKCAHPKSPRTRHFRSSCSTIGVDSTFMTKKHVETAVQLQSEDSSTSTGLIVVLTLLGICMAFFCLLSGLLIRRELKGTPLFNKLKEPVMQKQDASGSQIGTSA